MLEEAIARPPRAIFAGQIDANTELNKKQIERMEKLILSEKPGILFIHWPMDPKAERANIKGL
ncbi:MAG: hypothetical protein Q8918_13970 [Bacteroidota bacterium]|nr:hypothetical protein [Bacteroidota bacterium]MDP4251208.1 hypothetical protein [Bacteroidota bacterium]